MHAAPGNGHGTTRKASAPLERVPPQNLEAEQSVLGSILLDNDVLHDVIALLRIDDFYSDRHQVLYRTIRDMYDRGVPVDTVTLAEELTRLGQFEKVGGDEALEEIVNSVPHAANAKYHAHIVRDKAISRRLAEVHSEGLQEIYSQHFTADQLLEASERRVFQIAEEQAVGETVEMRDVVTLAIDRITRRAEAKHPITGLATGYFDLDDLTGGFHPAQLVVLAARPSMGKTALVLNICEHVALERNTGVLLVSLEMGQLELAERLLCARSRVDGHKLRTGQNLGHREMTLLGRAYDELRGAPIFIDDTPTRTILQITANARRLKLRQNIGLVVVDYIQLIEAEESRDSRQEQIAKISRRLKTLARELQVPVIALSQLNRAVESREDRRPRMADLRECVTGETLVLLADGRRVPIRELVGTTPEVLSMTPTGAIARASSDKVWCVGRRPVFLVRLASGRSVRATASHRLYGAEGWVHVADLRPGDRLAVARRVPEPPDPISWPEARLALLGHLIGDGSYLNHQPLRYTTACEANSRVVEEAARREFGTTVRRVAGRGRWHQLVLSGNGNRWHPAGVNRWLRELGIFGQRSHEKRLPVDVFRLSNQQIAILVRHLWATDGCLHLRRKGSRGGPAVYFATASCGLAHDVAALLLRLGIVARIRTVSSQPLRRPLYQVAVSGATDQLRFLQTVGPFLGTRRAVAERLEDYLATIKVHTNVDTLPREVFGRVRSLMRASGISIRRMASLRGTACGGRAHFRFAPSRAVIASYAEILDDEELRRRSRDELFWDRVVAITPAGEDEVFDLTVPGPASWLADGIVSHNSGAIEQDADLVLLLHRPEYYDPNDQPGIAELNVAKNRNGATNTLKLTFLRNIMRFENLAAVEEPIDAGAAF